MAGGTDLAAMLRGLTVSVRPGRYTFVTVDDAPPLGDGVEAVIREEEGITAVVTVDGARRRGWPIGFVATWLTLDVRSALEAVGLTAAVAAALARDGIPANVLAGHHHDHILVPADRTDDAVASLRRLASR